jgi:hypothetical protein
VVVLVKGSGSCGKYLSLSCERGLSWLLPSAEIHFLRNSLAMHLYSR